MKRYDGEIAVVTGASSGIGRRIARDLAARGAVVVGLARREQLLDELRSELQRSSPASDTAVCDVGDTDAFRDRLARIEAQHGRVDILVNDAGIHLETPATGPDSAAVCAQLVQTNYLGAVTGTLTVLPGMVQRRSGVIVNVSSDSARAPEVGNGGYAASKAALSTFTESIALEVARHGVRVHVLYPAWVPTAMGMEGGEDHMPPKMVRRTEEQISDLVLERMGGSRLDLNASRLPLVAVVSRAMVPRLYARGLQRVR
jgi:short-subunit dehydrogenase